MLKDIYIIKNARDYNINYKVISKINSGKNHYRKDEKYPIRG